MATENTTATQNQGSASNQAAQQPAIPNTGQAIQLPPVGQDTVIQVLPGQQVNLGFPSTQANVFIYTVGNDVIIAQVQQSGDQTTFLSGQIILKDFAQAANAEAEDPWIVFADGSRAEGDLVVAVGNSPDNKPTLPTAAGPGGDAQGSGSNRFSDDQGEAIAGLNANGPVPPTPFPTTLPEFDEPIEGLEDDDPVIDVTPPNPLPATPGFDPEDPDSLPPIISEIQGVVDESALPDGTGGGTLQTSGTIEFDTGNDELGALEVLDKDGVWVDITNGGVVQGIYGTLVVNPDYTWTYTLNDNTLDHTDITDADGDGIVGLSDIVLDPFTVRVTDDDGDQAQDSLIVGVTDDGPIAVDDATTGAFDTPVTYDVVANDLEGADGAVLQGAEMAAGSETAGTASFDPNTGEVTFTPNAGFFGVAVIDYTIVDTEGDVSAATLTITIDNPPPPPPPNKVPETFDDTNWVKEDSVLETDLNFTELGNVLEDRNHDYVQFVGEFEESVVVEFEDVMDNDPDGGPQPLKVVSINSDVDGTLAVAAGTDKTTGTSINGDYGILHIGSDGSYNYVLYTEEQNAEAYATVQMLGDDETLVDDFDYVVSDGEDQAAPENLDITIFGTDDRIVISGDQTSVDEAGLNGGGDTNSALVSDSDYVGTGEAADDTPDNDDSETTSGSFSFSAPDGLLKIDVGGTELTKAQLQDGLTFPVTIVTTFGFLTLTGYAEDADGNGGTVSYEYELNNNVDHSGGPVDDTITFTVHDDDLVSDTASGSIIIDIVNDAPIANDDFDSVLEDTTTQASGNVIDGLETGDTDDVDDGEDGEADIAGADGKQGVIWADDAIDGDDTAPDGVDEDGVIYGNYGHLLVGDSGDYTYVLDNDHPDVQALSNEDTLEDTFDYMLHDQDDDSDPATLTITINGKNDIPNQEWGLTVDEEGLTNGITGGPNDDVVPDSDGDGDESTIVFTVDFGDEGSGTIDFSALHGMPVEDSSNMAVFTVDGVAMTWDWDAPSQTLVALANDDNAEILKISPDSGNDYKVEILEPMQHNEPSPPDGTSDEDNIGFSLEFGITDGVGGNGTGFLFISVDDDSPTVNIDFNGDDPDSVVEGNSINGDWQSGYGADGGVEANDVEISINGTTITGAVGDTIDVVTTDGDLGDLVVATDGTWTFDANDNLANEGGPLNFTFTIAVTDGDGDTATDSHTIGVTDGAGPTGPDSIALSVDEDDLSGFGGNPGGPGDLASPDDSEVMSFTPGAHPIATYEFDLTSDPSISGLEGGVESWMIDGSGHLVGSVDDVPLIRIELSGGTPTGDVTVTAVLLDTWDHDIDTNTEDDIVISGIVVKATDTDGDSATGVAQVTVDDDTPVVNIDDQAPADPTTVQEGDTIAGDWAYSFGADGGVEANDVEISINGTTITGAVGDTIDVVTTDGDLGDLVVATDGTWTFDANDNLANEGGPLNFTFTIAVTDGDGDTATDSHTIGVTDGAGPTGPDSIALSVDEDDLSGFGGNPGGPGDLASPDDSEVMSFTPGAHPIATYEFDLTSDPSISGLEGGVESWMIDGSGHLVGSVDDVPLIRIELSGGTPTGDVTVTAVLLDTWDHDIDTNTEDDIVISGIVVKATDTDGDSATGVAQVTVDDDTPVVNIDDQAPADPTTVQEGDTIAGDWAYSFGADGGVEANDVEISINGTTITGAVGDTIDVVTTDGDLGDLVVATDGTWTFDANDNLANEGGPLNFTFTIAVTDGDGDTATDSHTIGVTDGAGPTGPDSIALSVDEDDLSGFGGNPGGPGDLASPDDSEVMSFTPGAHPIATYEFDLTSDPSISGLEGGVESWMIDGSGHLVGSVDDVPLIRIELSGGTPTGDVTVTAVLLDTWDHDIDTNTEDDIVISGIVVKATDTDGDSATGVAQVTVDDDTPVVNIDDQAPADPTTVQEGDTIAGDWAYSFGADGGVEANDVEISINGTTITGAVGDTIDVVTTDGDLGDLVVATDGTWTFDANDNLANEGGPLNFTFTIAVTDGDGDTATDSHTIGVTDGAGPTGPDSIALSVDEDDLSGFGGNPGGPGDLASPDDSEVMSFTPGAHPIATYEFDLTSDPSISGLEGGVESWMIDGSGHLVGSVDDVPLIRIELSGGTPTGDVTVTAVLLDTWDHDIDTNTEDDIVISGIVVKATDTDGDSATGVAQVTVDDDTPVVNIDDQAPADPTTVQEGDTIAGDWAYSFGADGGVEANDVEISINGTTITGAVGDTIDVVTTDGDLGDLVVATDGTWTFDANDNLANEGGPLNFTFTIAVTDGDGDTATDSHTIGVTDGAGPTGPDSIALSVDEDDLSGFGGNPGGPGDLASPDDSEVMSFTPGAHPIATYEFDLTSDPSISGLEGGVESWMIDGSGHLVGSVDDVPLIRIELSGGTPTGDVTVTAVLLDTWDHDIDTNTEDDIVISGIVVKATDTDGDSATGVAQVTVDDDTPVVNIDDQAPADPTTVQEGDTIAGDWAYSFGADGGVEANDVEISINGTTITGAVGDTIDVVTTDGDLGDLVVATDGTWTFDANDNLANEGGPLNFTFTIAVTDGDGDTATDSHTIGVTDGAGPTGPDSIALSVDEDDLSGFGGNPGGPGDLASPDDSEVMSFTPGAHPIATYEFDLTSDPSISGLEGGVESWMIDGSGHLVGSVDDVPLIRIELSGGTPTGDVTVTAVLLDTWDHDIDTNTEDDIVISGIVVKATDTDGDSATGVAQVTVDDDTPVVNIDDQAPADPTTVQEGDTIAGDWAYSFGADGGVEANDVEISINGTTITGAVGDTIDVVTTDGDLGDLVVATDGTWTFDANDNLANEGGPLNFTFTIAVTDGDGDTATDSHTIGVTDGPGPVGGDTLALLVDEDELAGGNPGGTGDDNEILMGELSFTPGSDPIVSYAFDFGATPVVSGTTDTIAWSNDSGDLVGSVGGTEYIRLSLSAGTTANDVKVTATLSDNFNHTDGMDENDITISGITVEATDLDGDTATGTVTLTVDDDTPELDWIQDAIIANDPDNLPSDTLIGEHNLSIGADDLNDTDGLQIDIVAAITPDSTTGPAIISGPDGNGVVSVTVQRDLDGQEQDFTFYYDTNFTYNGGGTSDVTLQAYSNYDGTDLTGEFFEVQFKDDGTYEIVVEGELEALKTITLDSNAGVSGGNNLSYFIPEETGHEIEITGATDFFSDIGDPTPSMTTGGIQDTVNTSAQGLGVDGQNFHVNEAMFFEFTESQTIVSFGVNGWSGTSTFEATWYTYTDEAAYNADVTGDGELNSYLATGTKTMSPGDPTIDINSSDFEYLVLVGTGGTAGGDPKVKIGQITFGATEFLDDLELTFEVTATDMDGDTISDEFQLTLDADETPETDGHDIVGGSGDEVILGSDGNDVIDAGGGNDEVYAGEGDDTVSGGAGNDYLSGGLGNDLIDPGAGDDTVDLGAGGADTVDYGTNAVSSADVIEGFGSDDVVDLDDLLTGLGLDINTDVTLGSDNPGLGGAAADGTIHVENGASDVDITVVDLDNLTKVGNTVEEV